MRNISRENKQSFLCIFQEPPVHETLHILGEMLRIWGQLFTLDFLWLEPIQNDPSTQRPSSRQGFVAVSAVHMPTLQNTLWCHKFPPPLGTSWGLSSRKLLCYSIILDYGNIVGDSSWASSIKCITANSAAAVALQKAGWGGPWLPQSSLSACDAMLSRNVRCCHSCLPCTLFLHVQAHAA